MASSFNYPIFFSYFCKLSIRQLICFLNNLEFIFTRSPHSSQEPEDDEAYQYVHHGLLGGPATVASYDIRLQTRLLEGVCTGARHQNRGGSAPYVISSWVHDREPDAAHAVQYRGVHNSTCISIKVILLV